MVRPTSVQRRALASVSHLPMDDIVQHACSLLIQLLSPFHEASSRLPKLLRAQSHPHAFVDAIRDGYLLCLLLSILCSTPRPVPSSQNISQFLSTCSSLRVPSRFLFSQDDLLYVSSSTLASSIVNIVNFLRSKPVISSRAAASTPNLLTQRPLPPAPIPNVLLLDDDQDDSDPEDYLLSSQSTPLTSLSPSPMSLPKPPLKSPLRKSLTSSSPSPLPKSPSRGILSWAKSAARPVSNLRVSTGPPTLGASASNLNLPGLVSAAASKVSLRKGLSTLSKPETKSVAKASTLIKSPPKAGNRSQTGRELPLQKTKVQSPLPPPSPTRIRTQSPPAPSRPVLVQDSRRSRSPTSPTTPSTRMSSVSPSPTSPRSPSTPRSPMRMRSTGVITTPSSSSKSIPTRGEGSDTPTRIQSRHRDRGSSIISVPDQESTRNAVGSTSPYSTNGTKARANHHQQAPSTLLNDHHYQRGRGIHRTNSSHMSPPPGPIQPRPSVQSIQSMTSTLSDGTTVLSAKSSLFDSGVRAHNGGGGMHKRPSGGLSVTGGGGNYGTIRTVTTELTEAPVWDDEDDADDGRMKVEDFEMDVEELDEMSRNVLRTDDDMREGFQFPSANGGKKQDLSRVNEVEEDESTSGCEKRGRGREREKERFLETEKNGQKSPMNFHLGKGKFPDDFDDVFGNVAEVRSSNERYRDKERKYERTKKELPFTPVSLNTPMTEAEMPSLPSTPSPARPIRKPRTTAPIVTSSSPKSAPSLSPPRKLAYVGKTSGDSSGSVTKISGSLDVGSAVGPFPRRPTHWSRRSVDVPHSSSSSSAIGNPGSSNHKAESVPAVGLAPRSKSRDISLDARVPRRHSTSATRKGGTALASPSPTGFGSSGNVNGSGRGVSSRHDADGSGSSGSKGLGNGDGDGLERGRLALVKGGQVKGSVPFPRTVSAEYSTQPQQQLDGKRGLSPPPPPLRTIGNLGSGITPPRSSDPSRPSAESGAGLIAERSRMTRERYQSNIENGFGRRRRPSSYDEVGLSAALGLGGKGSELGGRARLGSKFESMVNLSSGGGGLSGASASVGDLMTARDGGGSRRLIVREDGKPPTRYQLGNCIGRGQFGSVYRALNENTGQMVAVKRIRLEGLNEEEVMQLMKEVDLVKSLSHPSVVKYEGMVREEGMLNIVLEFAENGSLCQTLKSFGGKLNEALVARYVVKILEGLHYLHTSNIVHCDLKAANILTTKNGNVKLTDFGVSLNLRAMEREMGSTGGTLVRRGGSDVVEGGKEWSGSGSGGKGAEQHENFNVAGTPNWMAPEVIELKGASTKSDIWSLGCTVVELLTGKPPYADIGNAMSVMFRIVEDPMPPLPEKCDPLLEDFLRQCFHKNPALRPSAEKLSEHPWLDKNWSAFNDLRAQDSIPWIRRVSIEFQKNEGIRYISQPEIPESPTSASPKDRHMGGLVDRRTSASSKPSDGEFSPRAHNFVKTTFSKPMTCRVCFSDVKKTALICGQCSLISHSKCAPNAPPTCDLRAQLLLFAQYAEKGNPSSMYSNPAIMKNNVALSDVAFVEHSRTSLDGLPSSPPPPPPQLLSSTPPTAFKLIAQFKKSKSNLSAEPGSSWMGNNDEDHGHKSPVMQRIKRSFGGLYSSPPPISPPLTTVDRPVSSAASSSSSLKSAATANESFSSRQNTGRLSSPGGSGGRSSATTPSSGNFVVIGRKAAAVRDGAALGSRSGMLNAGEEEYEEAGIIVDDDTRVLPGGLPGEVSRKKKRGSSSANCMLQ